MQQLPLSGPINTSVLVGVRSGLQVAIGRALWVSVIACTLVVTCSGAGWPDLRFWRYRAAQWTTIVGVWGRFAFLAVANVFAALRLLPRSGREKDVEILALRSQAGAIVACDLFETVTLTGQRISSLAVIEHATRRIHILGTTAPPTAACRSCARSASLSYSPGCVCRA
jgi:hypothetical protein